MGFREDLRFLIGALGHGLDFESAYNIYSQAKASKQERKDEKRAALANLLTTGTELAQTVTNDESLTDLLGMYGKAFGAKPGQVSKVAGALTQMTDPTEFTPEDADAIAQRFMPVVEGMVARGDTAQAIRQHIREQVQRENPELQDQAVWDAVQPSFDATLESMLLTTGMKGRGLGVLRHNAAGRAAHSALAPKTSVGSPEEASQRINAAQPPPAAEAVGDDSGGLGVAALLAKGGARGKRGYQAIRGMGAGPLASALRAPKYAAKYPATASNVVSRVAGPIGSALLARDAANLAKPTYTEYANRFPEGSPMQAGMNSRLIQEPVIDRVFSWLNPFD